MGRGCGSLCTVSALTFGRFSSLSLSLELSSLELELLSLELSEAAELWLSLELPGSKLLGWAGASFFCWGWAALPVHQADKLDSSRGKCY